MLSDMEWADRMAIPVTYISAVGAPDAAAFMTTLTMWRFDKFVNRDEWFRKVIVLRMPELSLPDRLKSGSGNTKCAFFDSLLHKCLNIYGGTSMAADPLALIRHPWSLSAYEFKESYEAIVKQKLPDGVPDDRDRHAAALSLLGSAPALVGIFARTPQAIFTGVVLASTAILIDGLQQTNANTREREQIRSNFIGYADIYKREAHYRQREGQTS